MIQGLYAAANGLRTVEDRQAIAANNIANVGTPGFKRQVAVQQGFYEVFLGKLGTANRYGMERTPGGGLKLIESFSDVSTGNLQYTGNPLDVAINGPGYFAVETADGERYTRNGQFTLGEDGTLMTADGHMVLSEGGGPITIDGPAEIDREGNVIVNGENIDRIGVVEFEDPHVLMREGHTLFVAPDDPAVQPVPLDNPNLTAKAIEGSNVALPKEMINLMGAVRAYEANQRVISAIDDSVRRLIEQVGGG